ncbi:YczE/YyaS/YitT family protein [Pectinatus frisingensis]|uniref:YczE/YyaS/YitT family protein n=1 Tax=Pectinatus frisingensis TaxID=865 RepID=UPI0018C542AD|nr:DUF6198 family protein [Pectinatus frisingensis]
MKIIKNYLTFIIGLFFMALGIDLIIKSSLGTSPISSLPYVISTNVPFSLGEVTFVVNMFFLFLQWVILRDRLGKMQILQIPMTLIFAMFIDNAMQLLEQIPVPDIYMLYLMVLLLGCLSMGIGITCEILGRVVMLPGEGIVNAIAINWHLDFGRTKVVFDCFLVLTASLLSLVCSQTIVGIREGTIISALLTGMIVKFILSTIMRLQK